MILTHAPEANQFGAGALQRPKSSLYGGFRNGEGLTDFGGHVRIGTKSMAGERVHRTAVMGFSIAVTWAEPKSDLGFCV